MISRRVAGLCWFWRSIVFSVCIANSAFTAEPPVPPETLRYRRVFVPADDLSSQAKGMIPIRREEFERRVANWISTQPRALASQVRVEQAVYSARLEGTQFVDGKAQLEVVNAAAELTPFTWDSTLALGKPQWDEQPPRPARLGTTPEGVAILLVEKSGRLSVPWTMRGMVAEGQDASFDLKLPKAAISRVILQLPAGLVIESDAGIVSRLKPDAVESQLFSASVSPIANWLIELGGLSQLRLRVSNPSKITQHGGVVLVRESATHILSPADVSSEFNLQLDVHQTELTSLKLELDSPTRVIGVKVGGSKVPWREAPAANPQQTMLQIDLSETLMGSGNSVVVNTVAALTMDRSWRLPRLRLTGSTWQEGTAALVVPPALQIGSLQLVDARQISSSPGSSTQPEQTYQFQYLSPLGQVAAHPIREIPRLKVLGGLVVRHEATQISATLNVDLAVDFGERFAVEGITSADWIVDSVDTAPQDLIEERQFVPLAGRRFALRLRLARPLNASQKTRLVIRAHRQLPAEGESLTAPHLRLVEFQEVRDEQYVVALRATDSSREFQVSGDLDLFRLDPESAAPEELSLLDSSAAGTLFRLDRQGEGARVSLVPSDPRFTAAIESSALVQRGRIEHRIIARITPMSASLSRLIVRSSGPIPAAMRWRLIGSGDLSIASQTLLPVQTPPTLEGERESVWELVFSRITTQPLALEAAWETSFSLGEALPLFSFPGAASQNGLVKVEAGQGISLRIDTAGVKPVPAPLAPAESYSSIRGLFRYEPGRQAVIRPLESSQEDSLSAAWANSCLLESRYSLDGSATHEFTWRLENHGVDRFPFSVPAGARLLQISLDGEDIPIPSLDAKTQQYFVSLPEGRRNPVVSLSVSTAAPRSSSFLVHRWMAPLLTTPLPVLDRSWQVLLPPSIRPVSNESAAEVSRTGTWYEIWKNRLWGGLATSNAVNHAERLELPWSESEPLVVSVYSPILVQIVAIALAIAAASLVVSIASRRLNLVFVIAAIGASAALLLPQSSSPLAAGIFWGCLSGWLLSLVRPKSTKRIKAPPAAPSTRTMLATSIAGSILFIALAALHLPSASAAPGDPLDAAAVPKIHRVVIPVDAAQKPQGDYVYISLDFYTTLYRAPEREQLPAWLLRSAAFELQADEDSVTANIVMRLEIETLVAKASVSLPIRRGEVHLLEGRATLDGVPVSLDWNDGGTALRFDVDRPGLYQLILEFSAAARPENGLANWRFSIPPTPRTTLRIKSPTRPGDWPLSASQGAATKSSDEVDLLVELGSTAVFNVGRKVPNSPATDTLEAEQLVWWKLRPGSVTADALIRVRPVNGKIKEIRLLADPQLRLLPLENEPLVARVWVEEGEPNIIHLTLMEPATETVQLKGRFLLLNASGIGRLVLPRLEVMADRKTMSWQALSVGQDHEISRDPETPIVLHPPVEFVDGFGGAARPPNLAWEAVGQSPAFLIRPREGIVRTKEFIDISLGRTDAEILYRVNLSDIPPHRFQEVIDLPVGFRVKKAVLLVRDSGALLPAQIVQQDSITIHRAQPPDQAQQLVVEGTLPLPALPGQPNTVRLPGLRSAASDGATVRIYRTPATLALIRSADGIEPTANPEGAPWEPRLGHLLASFKSTPSSQPIQREFVVETRPNNPVASYRLMTRMERTAVRSWSAVVHCDVSLQSGSLDTLRLEVPMEWSGPFEFSPPMDHQVVLLPGQTQRHLVIRPPQSQSGKLSFSIRGPVKLQAGETPHAPLLLPLDSVRTDSFLMLPGRIAGEGLTWQTSGLQAMAAIESKDSQLVLPGHEVFRVVAPRYTATLMPSKDSHKSGRITYADITVRPTRAGDYWARASYFLFPGDSDVAELQMPIGSQLLQVLINDSVAEIRGQSEGNWKVRLGHEQLPQHVVVIYEFHQKDAANNAPQVLPPVWKGMAVDRTTWSLLPDQVRHPLAPETMQKVSDAAAPRIAALARMSAIVRLVRDGGETGLSGLPPQQLGDWLSLWRLEFALANLVAQPAALPASESSLAPPGDTLETQRRALEVEFSAVLSRYTDISSDFPSPALSKDMEVMASGREHAQFFQTRQFVPLTFESPAIPSNFSYRLALAVFLLALCLTAAFVSSVRWFQDSFAVAPAYLLAIFATACLFLLPNPLVAALLPTAAAAWFSLRSNWPPAKTD